MTVESVTLVSGGLLPAIVLPAAPTTIMLDRQGRRASRIVGQLDR